MRRTWFARMSESAEGLMKGILPPDLAPAAAELAPYWADSFGNATRIDYGTGHETTFAALLCCLAKLGVFVHADLQASHHPVPLLPRAAGLTLLSSAHAPSAWPYAHAHVTLLSMGFLGVCCTGV
jgi:hypothetical protein